MKEDLIIKLKSLGIQANEIGSSYFVLFSILKEDWTILDIFDNKNKDKSALTLYKNLELKKLIRKGTGKVMYELTEEGRELTKDVNFVPVPHVAQEDVESWIGEWVALWKDKDGKSYKFGSRSLACSSKEALSQMNKFLIDYKHLFEGIKYTPKEVIMGATREYIEQYRKVNFAFCKEAYYMIRKAEGGGNTNIRSVLASECENFIAGKNKPKSNTSFNIAI